MARRGVLRGELGGVGGASTALQATARSLNFPQSSRSPLCLTWGLHDLICASEGSLAAGTMNWEGV